ncbi:MAG: response regulator [Bacteroidetes bacterium HGW-Bacteroidetes-5]|jgi:CheY-like chemotaxis protein|nr:MAG: response regulator [Bacteroidetes bacterium HGW-Bacteroidetes-5]
MMMINVNILLADDDEADCLLFKNALEELPVCARLTIVHNGEQVIEELTKNGKEQPDVLFLDLNMPRKNGFATLGAIKRSSELQSLPVIIFSTASDTEMVKIVFRDSAHYYICKPNDFSQLKKVIYEALTLITQKDNPLPLEENFMITGKSIVIP